MAELDGGNRVGPAQKIGDSAIAGHMLIVVDARAPIRFATNRRDGRFLAKDDSGAAECELAQMDQMPIGRTTIVGAVLAHRRDDDPVARDQPTQRNRSEQQGRRSVGFSGHKSIHMSYYFSNSSVHARSIRLQASISVG